MKGVAVNDEPRENYPKFAALLGFTKLYSEFQLTALFNCLARNLSVLVHPHCSHGVIFGCSKQLFSAKKSYKKALYLLSPKQQTKFVIVEHLAAEQPDISICNWQKTKLSYKRMNIGLKFIRWPDTRLQMRDNVTDNTKKFFFQRDDMGAHSTNFFVA